MKSSNITFQILLNSLNKVFLIPDSFQNGPSRLPLLLKCFSSSLSIILIYVNNSLKDFQSKTELFTDDKTFLLSVTDNRNNNTEQLCNDQVGINRCTLQQKTSFNLHLQKQVKEVKSSLIDKSINHCVKSVLFSNPYFPAFGLNTEGHPVFLPIHSKCGKIRTRKTPNTNTFHAINDPPSYSQ